MIDQYDRLLAICDLARYPTNLARTKGLSHILQLYQAKLHDNEKILFEARSKYHAIGFLDAYDGDGVFISKTCKTIDNIKEHLQKNRKDPRCRHVFIQAESSRSPLDCSMPMLEYILSFHQVSPSFLELVLAFGKGKQPQDFHYTGFRHESFLDQKEADIYAIDRLGRSGREIKQSYNLWSVETAASSGQQPWSIRQMAVYHSFDVDTGRSFWINIKANDIIKSRMTNEALSSNKLCANTISDLNGSFAATLTTHSIHFEWCRENWRLYIASLQKRLDDVLKKVYAAPVELVERDLAVDGNALIQPLKSGRPMSPTLPSRTATFGSETGTFSRQTTGLSTVTNSMFSSLATAFTGPKNGSTTIAGSPPQQTRLPPRENASGERNTFEIFEQFSIAELQRLYRTGSALQEARLVMRLNTDVLLEIAQSYDRLINDSQFPRTMKEGCSTAIHEFFEHSKCIIKELEREQHRVTTLIQMLDNGKSMFETILQFRNIETNKLFTLHAHLSGQRTEYLTHEMHKSTIEMERMTKSMHTIAEKTERETASMHIITFVTLIFLPGTFIAVSI